MRAPKALVDTNVLVYRVDPRDAAKQAIATDLLRRAIADLSIVLPHQALVEFVAATTRFRPELGGPLLAREEALRETERLLLLAPVLYPNAQLVRNALRGTALFGLSWFDAHLWAYAETHGLSEIWSEDFEHGRRYGTVRVTDPFHELTADEVHESGASYG